MIYTKTILTLEELLHEPNHVAGNVSINSEDHSNLDFGDNLQSEILGIFSFDDPSTSSASGSDYWCSTASSTGENDVGHVSAAPHL